MLLYVPKSLIAISRSVLGDCSAKRYVERKNNRVKIKVLKQQILKILAIDFTYYNLFKMNLFQKL